MVLGNSHYSLVQTSNFYMFLGSSIIQIATIINYYKRLGAGSRQYCADTPNPPGLGPIKGNLGLPSLTRGFQWYMDNIPYFRHPNIYKKYIYYSCYFSDSARFQDYICIIQMPSWILKSVVLFIFALVILILNTTKQCAFKQE